MSTSWMGRQWFKLHQRRLSLMFYLAAGLAFVATLALAGTAFHFSTATLTAARQINDTAVRQSAAANEFTLLVEANRRVVFRARNAKDIDNLIVSMGILAPIEQRLFNFVERGELAADGRLRSIVHDMIGTGRILLTARALGVDDADAAPRYMRLFALATAHARRIRAQAQDLSSVHIVSLQRAADDLRHWTAFFGVLALICTGPFSFFLLHNSILRLRQVTRALRHLASGNLSAVSLSALTESASDQTPDEISMMIDAIKVYHFTAQSLEESRHEVQRVNSRLQVALENMSRGLSMFGPDERLVICNGSYKRMYDLPDHLTVAGASLQALLEWRARASPGDKDVPKIITRYRAAIASRQPLRYTRSLSDGRTIEISLQPLEDGGWVTVHQDVTKEREAEAKISRLAKEDALTGLVNRRGFTEALDAISRRDPVSTTESYAILCIDLDLFKSVNDTLGHPAGDEVLRIVARRLRSATREHDIIARIGGDEFAVIIDGIHDIDAVHKLAARLVRMLSEPMAIANTHAAIGASIGIAMSSRQPLTSANLLAQADMALYWAKSHGRNTWRIYDAEIEAPIKLRRQLESDMRPGLLDGQFTLNFQPIFGLDQRDVIACEALVRWRHPDRGFVSPADFIPIAERNGFIKELGAWVLENACRIASDWPQNVRVAVNISAVQLQSPDFFDLVAAILERTQYSPQRLELEVTETAILDDSASTIATLHKLKGLGIIISLDDFGTGYSSLSYLRRFPFDQLKIDQSFVRDSSNRDDCIAIVRAIAGLAESLDMTTVAEGVETYDHLAKVRLAGCSAVQGYLFSKPVPAEDVAALFPAWKELMAA